MIAVIRATSFLNCYYSLGVLYFFLSRAFTANVLLGSLLSYPKYTVPYYPLPNSWFRIRTISLVEDLSLPLKMTVLVIYCLKPVAYIILSYKNLDRN